LAQVLLDLVRQLDGGDALRRFILAGHFGDVAAACRAPPLIGRQFVANVYGR